MQNWKTESKSLTGHDLSLLQTFARSWEHVQDANTQNLFIACGYCAPNTPIPAAILQAALGEENDACDECLNDLLSLGLLKEGTSIHPLLAQFALKLDIDHKLLKEFSDALGEIAARTNKEEAQSGVYSLFTPILPHVRNVAEHSEKQGLDAAGLLWNELGVHIKILADYAGAKAAYERALKILEKFLPPNHPSIKIVRGNLESL